MSEINGELQLPAIVYPNLFQQNKINDHISLPYSSEPAIIFTNSQFMVNPLCLKLMPNTKYVQILINPTGKKLAIRPCKHAEKDSFCWCSVRGKKKPAKINCPVFYGKVFKMMEWNIEKKYVCFGKILNFSNEILFMFDLTSSKVFKKSSKSLLLKSSRSHSFQTHWQEETNRHICEYQESITSNVFNDYIVFGILKVKKEVTNNNESEMK